MTQQIEHLYTAALLIANDPTTAAILTLAEVLSQKTEPLIIEPVNCTSYSVAEAAKRLNLKPRTLYSMCIRGKLRCFKTLDQGLRIPLDEIKRLEN